MNRMIVAIPTGLVAGALVGLMIGGLWLHWQLGTDMNAGHPFVLITDFPGLRAARQDPWRSAYGVNFHPEVTQVWSESLGLDHRTLKN